MPKYRVTRVAYYRYEHTDEYEAPNPKDARRQSDDYAASCDFWDHTTELSYGDLPNMESEYQVTRLKG